MSGMINTSCKAGHSSCKSAFDLGDGNNISVRTEGGAVMIDLTAVNPYAPRQIPKINGSSDLSGV